jgi:plastocyanin
VTIEGSRFTPSTLTVHVGDSIVWVNKDLFPHTATSSAAPSSTARFDSQAIAPERSWTYKASVKGEFDYVCSFHPTMKGTLRVQ